MTSSPHSGLDKTQGLFPDTLCIRFTLFHCNYSQTYQHLLITRLFSKIFLFRRDFIQTTNNFLLCHSQDVYSLSLQFSIYLLFLFINKINKIYSFLLIHIPYYSYSHYSYSSLFKKSGNNSISVKNYFQHMRILNRRI